MMSPWSASAFESLFQFAPDAFLAVDRAGRIALVNHQAETLFGYSRGELLGRPLDTLVPERLRTPCAELLSHKPVSSRTSLVGLRRDGAELPLEVSAEPVDVGDQTLLFLVLRDVSGERLSQQEFQARARRQSAVSELGRRALTGIDLLQLMTEACSVVRSNLAVAFTNVLELLPDGRLTFRTGEGWTDGMAGRATTETFSDTPASTVLVTQTPVVVEDFRTDERFPDASLLREHGVVSSVNVPLYGHDRPFGVLGAHATHAQPFAPEDVAFLQSVANVLSAAIERDLYEQRRREQYLQRAEQMVALGQVAAGVAHELRNPLTAVKGLIQVNLRRAKSQGLPAEDLAVIEHEIRRMERTLQTFLDFARPPQPDRRRLGLCDVVDRVFALVKGRAKKQNVNLRQLRSGSPVQIEADRDQLQQLLLNLVLNALDAMPRGGAVEIDVRPPRDGHVELYVRDTGPGIAADVLPKVFETFVSSKETGVGLGLPVSRRIAEDHGGTLSAYNLPGGGACFTLRLPAVASSGHGGSGRRRSAREPKSPDA